MKPIYEYLDYRAYLRDFFAENKNVPHLSHRAILQKMGVSSCGFLSNVVAGRNNMSIQQADRFSQIAGHSENEAKFLKKLIYYSKAKSIAEKNDQLEQLLAERRPHAKNLALEELSLFKKWYYVIIRDMLNYYWFVDDYESLAARLDPPIPPDQAREAIEHLEFMGLISKNDKGCWIPCEAVVSTGDEIRSRHVVDFQIQMIDIAKRAIETVPKKDRDISALSMAISERKMEMVKNEVRKFRKKLLQIASTDDSANRMYMCNIQLFPVTRTTDTPRGEK